MSHREELLSNQLLSGESLQCELSGEELLSFMGCQQGAAVLDGLSPMAVGREDLTKTSCSQFGASRLCQLRPLSRWKLAYSCAWVRSELVMWWALVSKV